VSPGDGRLATLVLRCARRCLGFCLGEVAVAVGGEDRWLMADFLDLGDPRLVEPRGHTGRLMIDAECGRREGPRKSSAGVDNRGLLVFQEAKSTLGGSETEGEPGLVDDVYTA
jgi:hypothetical protein